MLGTAFNFKTDDSNGNFEISLKSGRVSVFDTNSKKEFLVLEPSQYVTIDKVTMGFIVREQNMDNVNVWTNSKLEVYDEPLVSILSKLESWYGVRIKTEGLSLSKHYTFNIESESLEEFLDLFSILTPIKYFIDEKQVRIWQNKENND